MTAAVVCTPDWFVIILTLILTILNRKRKKQKRAVSVLYTSIIIIIILFAPIVYKYNTIMCNRYLYNNIIILLFGIDYSCYAFIKYNMYLLLDGTPTLRVIIVIYILFTFLL